MRRSYVRTKQSTRYAIHNMLPQNRPASSRIAHLSSNHHSNTKDQTARRFMQANPNLNSNCIPPPSTVQDSSINLSTGPMSQKPDVHSKTDSADQSAPRSNGKAQARPVAVHPQMTCHTQV
ncbi:hypothetical protein K505DRAFT_53026 [Melanomma pulvis-pyrius CBS 109.77]|uniref:Uncharacterized protein n=1 Tax=Melanomma pulvis-pyrius CBS 109.77 TaxID=1314802 RepID=A0A6A6XVD0_9PLEO|nr:hypothetical protein K505DRAFT_53026 [Melanomma pulvis-pyrius CBS 109.77]